MRSILFVLLIANLPCFSQSRERLDSLLRLEKNIKEDTNGIRHLIRTAKQYKKTNPDSANYYLQRALTFASKLNDHLFILKVYNEKTALVKTQGDIKTQVDTMAHALALAKEYNNPVFLTRFNLDLGVAYRRLGNYDKSVQCLLHALTLAQKYQYKADIYNSFNSLANTYSQAGVIKKSDLDLTKALGYYKKAFDASDKENKAVTGMILNNEGVTYYNLGQIKKDSAAIWDAIAFYKKSLAIRIETGDSAVIASSYNNLGSAYHQLCDEHKQFKFLDTALFYYEKALEIDRLTHSRESYSNLSNYAIHLCSIGRFKKDKNILKKAIRLMQQSLASSKENKDNYTAMVNTEAISLGFEELSRYDSAVYYMRKAAALKDTLLSEENKHIAEELGAKYESDLKDAENNNLKQQAELREEVINKKSTTIKLMVVASLIMLVLIVIVFISLQKIKKSREVIKQQQQETEKQKLLIEEKQKEILDSINYSKRLQDAAIPSVEYFRSLLPQSFIYYKPKDIVAGDFYWVHPVPSSEMAVSVGVKDSSELLTNNSQLTLVAAADCTGHGVPGALVSIVCLNALNRCVEEFGLSMPNQILDKATEIIQNSFRQSENDVKDGMDIALCLLDLNSGKGYFSGANNPVWILHGEDVREIKGDSQPVGQQLIPKPFTLHEFSFSKNDTILLSTDGYSDQFGGPKGKKLKTKKFKELFPKLNTLPMENVKETIAKNFENWKGNLEQVDDVLVIGIRV